MRLLYKRLCFPEVFLGGRRSARPNGFAVRPGRSGVKWGAALTRPGGPPERAFGPLRAGFLKSLP